MIFLKLWKMMEKINFKDLPSTETLINSSNLNLLQDNVENAINGFVLYENETGSNASITLSDSAANYSYIEIFFQAEGRYNSIKIPNANGKIAYLHSANVLNGNAYYKMSNWQIDGSNINLKGSNQYRISASGASDFIDGGTGGNAIYITKVVGYK